MGRIFITGDTHGDFYKLEDFCRIEKTTIEDVVIILGDVGFNYYGDSRDSDKKRFVSKLPITVFCIKGNHENYAGNIAYYKEIEFWGGKALIQSKYSNLIFAIDGQIYDIEGKKTIVIGGAYSVDKEIRLKKGHKWFSDEQPSEETKKLVEEVLKANDWKVDVVLSHTCPIKYEPTEWFLNFFDQSKVDKSTELWLDKLEDKLDYDKWYCGHYHGDKTFKKITFLFYDFVKFFQDL